MEWQLNEWQKESPLGLREQRDQLQGHECAWFFQEEELFLSWGMVASRMTDGVREWRSLVHTDSMLSWEHWDPLKDFGQRNGKSIPEASKQLESGPAQSGRQISLEDIVNFLAVEMPVGQRR